MDLIYRKDQIKDTFATTSKISRDSLMESPEGEVRGHVNRLIEKLRDKSDIGELNMLYSILIMPLIILLIWLNFKLKSLGISFLPFIMLIAYFIGVNLVMKKAINENISFKWNNDLAGKDPNAFLLSKIKYLKSAINIKLNRMRCIQFFYMLFFPIFLVTFYFLVFNKSAFDHLWIALLIAYTLASTYWYYYFERDNKEYYELQSIAEKYRSMVVSFSTGEEQ